MKTSHRSKYYCFLTHIAILNFLRYKNEEKKTYRVVGRNLTSKEVNVNSMFNKSTMYHLASQTFHQVNRFVNSKHLLSAFPHAHQASLDTWLQPSSVCSCQCVYAIPSGGTHDTFLDLIFHEQRMHKLLLTQPT